MGYDPIDNGWRKWKRDGGVGYSEVKKTELLSPVNAPFAGGMINLYKTQFNDGTTYLVTWDGAKYSCTGFTASMDGTTAVLVGNGKIYGFEDTGEPFVIISAGEDAMVADLANIESGANSTHTVGITELAETIHPIDPKYLPEEVRVEKTVLYEGKPQKLDLSAYNLGTLYLVSTENLLPLAEGQDIYYEYTANGETITGILDVASTIENGAVTFMVATVFHGNNIVAVQYNADLGGMGFGLMHNGAGVDFGEISLKLWTEYRPYGNYIIRTSTSDEVVNIDHEKVCKHRATGNLVVRFHSFSFPVVYTQINGSNAVFYTIEYTNSSAPAIFEKYTFVNGVYQPEA